MDDSKVLDTIAGLIKLKKQSNNEQSPTTDTDIKNEAQDLIDRYETLNNKILDISDVTSKLVDEYAKITDTTDKLVRSKNNSTDITESIISSIDTVITNFDILNKNLKLNANLMNEDVIKKINAANKIYKSAKDPEIAAEDIERHIKNNRTRINRSIDGFFDGISSKFTSGLRTIAEVINLPKTLMQGIKKSYSEMRESWSDFTSGIKTGDFNNLFMSKDRRNEDLTLGISKRTLNWNKIKTNSVTGVAITELMKEMKKNGYGSGGNGKSGDSLVDNIIEGGTQGLFAKMFSASMLSKILGGLTKAGLLTFIIASVGGLGAAIAALRNNDLNKKSPEEATGKKPEDITSIDKWLNDMFQGTFGNRGSGSDKDRYKNGTNQAWNLGMLGAGLGAFGALLAVPFTGGTSIAAAPGMIAGGAALGGMIGSGVGAAGGFTGGDDLTKFFVDLKDKLFGFGNDVDKNTETLKRRNNEEDSVTDSIKNSKKQSTEFNKNLEKANKEIFPSFFTNLGTNITTGLRSAGNSFVDAGKKAGQWIVGAVTGKAPTGGLGLGPNGMHLDKDGKVIRDLTGNASKYDFTFDEKKYKEILKSRGVTGKDLERRLGHARGLFNAANELKKTKYNDLDVNMMMNQAILESGNFKSSLTDSLNPWGAKVSKSKLLAPLQNGRVNKHNNIEGGRSDYGTYANWKDSAEWWYLRTSKLKKDDPATYAKELKASKYYGDSLEHYYNGLNSANNLGIIGKKLKDGIQEKTQTVFGSLSEAAAASLQASFDKTDNITYQNGSKNWKNGSIDCSGWVSSVTTAMFEDINNITGSEVFGRNAKKMLNKSSDNIVAGIAKATGSMLTKPKASQLKEGMILGLDANDTRGKGLGVQSIDHVAMVAKNKKGEMVVRESTSGTGKDGKTGVQETPLDKWLARQNKLGRDTFAVDPMLLADKKYKNGLVARGVEAPNITAAELAKKEAETAAANKKAEAQAAQVKAAIKESSNNANHIAESIKDANKPKEDNKPIGNTTVISAFNNEIPKHVFEYMFGMNIGGEKVIPSLMG